VNLLEEAEGKWSGRSEKLFLEKEGIRQVRSKGKKKKQQNENQEGIIG